MKRIFALLLSLCMLAGLFACGKSQQTTAPTTTQSTTQTDPTGTTAPDAEPNPFYFVDYETGHVTAGSIQAALANGESISVSYDDPYKGTPGFDYSTPDVFTFREYLTAGDDLQWSPQNWRTTEDAHILSYTTTGLYSFVLNSDLSGFTILCEMAAAPPEDVTAEFTGRYGIAEGETAKAWRIRLNSDAYWSNGEAINADTYLYSYRQLLDRRMEGSRAAEICTGDFAIYGAREYFTGDGLWENVGILKTAEYEIVFITEAPVSQPEFYVPYYLQSSYLVYAPLWESCKQYYDVQGNALSEDSADAVRITTNYCTSLKTSISYGPYTLVGYKAGTELALERNFTWFGYADGKHLGQYQADAISCSILSDYDAVLEAYRAGELDIVKLQAVDAAGYWDTGLLRSQPETYTTKLTFNTDRQALASRGNLVLANAYFRKALALSIDRSRFASRDGLGLINGLYLADAAQGMVYRDTESARTALQKLYGWEGDYETLTGLDREAAQMLMGRAYALCLKDGSYDGNSQITLQLSVSRQDDAYIQIAQLLQEAVDAACAGTGFAGKITIALTVDENCYNTMAQGQTDMILTTWGGNPCNPYDILYSCYCGDNRLEYGFDAGAVTVELEINEQRHSASLLDWARWCAGQQVNAITLHPFDSYTADSRAAIFAQLEYAYLSQFATTPLYSRATVVLLSEKGDYAVKNYRNLVAFGGIRYYTFFYTDVQWAQKTA